MLGQRSHSQNQNYLSGYLYTQNEYQQSEKRPLLNLDRIGAGDAYAAGILYGYSQNWSLEKAVTFATVNGVLAYDSRRYSFDNGQTSESRS